MNKREGFGAIGILMILIVVALAAGGGYLVFKNKAQESVSDNGTPAPINADDGTRDWKTYRSDQRGFEFKYPPTMFISNGPIDGQILIAQTSQPPKFGFEITCYFSSDFARVALIAKDIRTLGDSYNTQEKLLTVLEDNYGAIGGAKVSDKTVGDVRIARFEASEYGPNVVFFKGYAAYAISLELCGGGEVPFDLIVDNFVIL